MALPNEHTVTKKTSKSRPSVIIFNFKIDFVNKFLSFSYGSSFCGLSAVWKHTVTSA